MVENAQSRSIPEAERPEIVPGYGIHKGAEGLLSWEWVEQQILKARNYWICSVRQDGQPHAVPVWGVWIEGTLYFAGDPQSRKIRNLIANPKVVVHLESGDDTVIFEGVMERTNDLQIMTKMAKAYTLKYPGYEPSIDELTGHCVLGLRPHKVMAWLEKDYPRTATRWLFPES